MKTGTSTPLADVVIYLKWHPNWSEGLGGVGVRNSPIPLTLSLASNTAYCATVHTRDYYLHQGGYVIIVVCLFLFVC